MEQPGTPPPSPVPHLTPRERQVLEALCHPECWLEKQLPTQLGLSLSSFKTHREHLYAKCRVNTRQQLVVKAVRWGLVPCYCHPAWAAVPSPAAQSPPGQG